MALFLEKAKCELCRLYEEREIRTSLYYEDDVVIVVDCESCLEPMMVLKRHVAKPGKEEVQYMETVLREEFGEDVEFRGEMRSIPNHYHEHIV